MRGKSVNRGGLLRLDPPVSIIQLHLFFKIKRYIASIMKTTLNTFNKLTTDRTGGLLVVVIIISIIITQSPG